MTTLVWAQLTIPSAPVINSVAEPRRISSAGERQTIPLVYGEYRLGGLILNILKHGSDPTKVVVQILWCHKCDGILDVRLNDQALSAGTSATHYTGAQTTVDPTLLAAFAAQSITYTDTLTGYAYSVFSLPVVEFSGQLSFSARIKGRRLYDPRKDSTAGGTGSHRLNDPATWEWSDNPSLALADFLSNTTYGAGELVKWSSVITAANANDASIGSPAEKHRILGVAFTQQGSVYAIGEALRAYAGCWIVPDQAGIALLVDADAAAVATYAHSSGQIAALDRLDKRDLSTAPTVVEVVYTDTSKIPWRDAVAVAKVTGAGTTLPWRLSSVKLPGIHRYSQAYREAVERLNKLRLNDLSCTLEVFDIGIRHQIGDIVSVTHPIGPSAKPFRVVDIDSPKQGSWRLSLIEHDPAAYSTTVQTVPTYSDTSLVAPAGPPSDVTGLSATVAQGLITWMWNSPTDRNYLETQVRLGGTDWDSASPVWSGRGTQWLQRVTTTGTRTLRVKHVNQDGVLSTNAASASITVNSGDLVQSEPGTPGQSTVVVNLYQWATTQPSNPSGSSVWWWTTAAHDTYSGGNGWSTAIPANPGTAGSGLWVAAKPVTAAVGTVSSTVLWDSGYTVYKATINGSTGPTGPTGPAGAKTATATVYKWALTIPTVSGTGTYTWATGDVGTVPSGWTVQPGTGAAGQTLWAASVLLIDATGAATSSINWSTASVTARGYIGVDGATGPTGPAGADGISARRAYVLTTLGSLGTGTVVTTGINSLPPNGSFGVSGWTAAPGVPAVGETLYQSDGLYNPATNQITWETPYVSSLKVGSLSAISVNTGALTVQDNVTVSSTGAVRGGATGYALGTGFWQGYDVSAYKWRVGNPTGARIQWDGSAVEVYNSSNQLVMASGGDGRGLLSSGIGLGISAGGANLVGNSSFERWVSGNLRPLGWAFYGYGCTGEVIQVSGLRSGSYAVGSRCLSVGTPGGFGITNTTGPMEGGRVYGGWRQGVWYTISVWVRRAAGTSNLGGLGGAWNNWPNEAVWKVNPPLSSSWQRYEWSIRWTTNTPESNGYIYLNVQHPSNLQVGDEIWFDDLMIQEGDVATNWALSPFYDIVSSANPVTTNNVSTYIESAAIGSLDIATTGRVRSGKAAYGSGTGWLLEYNNGTPRFDLGDSTNYLRWNGADLVATALTVRKSDGTVLFSAKGASVPPWVTYVQPASGTVGYSLVSGVDPSTNTVSLKTLKAGDGVDIADSDAELVFSAPLAQTAIPSATGPATTSFAQVPGVAFQLDANSIYRFQANLQVSGSGNIELRFAFPSGSTVFGYAFNSINNPQVINFTAVSNIVGASAGNPILIDAVVVTGSSGGMFTPEFRRLSSGNAVSLVRGSWFSAEKIIQEFSTGGSLAPPISGMGGNSAIASVSGAAATSTSKLITRTSSQFTFTRSGRSNENYTWLGAGPASAFDVLYELVSATVEIAGQGSHTTSGFGVWQQMTVERTATMRVTADYTGAANVRQVRFTFNIKFRDRATGTITTWFAGNSGSNTQSVVVRAESGPPAGDPGGGF